MPIVSEGQGRRRRLGRGWVILLLCLLGFPIALFFVPILIPVRIPVPGGGVLTAATYGNIDFITHYTFDTSSGSVLISGTPPPGISYQRLLTSAMVTLRIRGWAYQIVVASRGEEHQALDWRTDTFGPSRLRVRIGGSGARGLGKTGPGRRLTAIRFTPGTPPPKSPSSY